MPALKENFIGKLIDQIRQKKYDTGLVLSGGAARGFAHAGVIKAMEEKGIEADIVSGVSAGSIVGAFYCDGYSADEIYEIFHKNRVFELVKLRFSKHGLLSVSGLRKVLKNNLRASRIEDLKKPLIITATNIEEGITTYFSEGDLVDTVIASCSIPILFIPAVIDGITYVDGGLTNNFPVQPLEEICKKMIGVHVNPVGNYDPDEGGLRKLAIHTFHLSIAADIQYDKKKVDHFIEPGELEDFTYYDIKKGKAMFDIGYKEAMEKL